MSVIFKEEENFQQNEDLLFRILNASQNGVQVLKSVRDEAGNIIDFRWIMVNDAVLKFWGKQREEIIGNRMLELFPGVKQGGLFDFYVLGASSNEYKSIQKYYNHEGFNHWIDLSVVRFEDGLIISSQDISQKKAADEELIKYNQELEKKVAERTIQLVRQREGLYSMFMQTPALVGILKGEDFVFELANPLYLKAVGKKDDIIGKPLLEVLPEFKGHPIIDHLKNVYKTGKRYIGNEVCLKIDVNNDGNYKDGWYNFVYEPFKDKNGDIVGILGHGFEVTDQFLARKKLETSQERLRIALEAGKMGTWELDLINDTSIRSLEHDIIFGYNQGIEEWGAKIFLDHVIPEDKDLVLKSLDNAYINQELNFECRIQRVDQQIRWIYVKGKAFFDQSIPVRMYGIIMDITESKENEENLKIKNEQLTKINNDLDNFIYTASHDLKAPMSNIEGLFYALRASLQEARNVVNQEADMLLDMMDQSINRFKATILDLTEITKAQKDDLEDFHINSLSDIVEDVKLSINDKIIESGAIIETDFSQFDAIHFSRKNLKSVIYNLLSNSIKYRDPSRIPEIFIKTEKAEDFYILSISDNGMGIPTNNLEKVFSMFKRFHDHVEGTGIGLYIVKRIVDNTGGKIEVDSEQGKGTTFRIFFKN